MTIEQCYQQIGGNYAEVCGRLPSQRLVEKFARKFLDDQSYTELVAAMGETALPLTVVRSVNSPPSTAHQT